MVLCSTLGHELRNPLAAVFASLHVVEAMTDDADPRAKFVNRAQADLERLRTSLDALLCLGSGRAAEGEPIEVDFAAHDFILRRRDARFSFVHHRSADATPTVVADRALLDRAVENLCENALRAGASSVELRLEQDADEVRLEVVDDGPGLPTSSPEELFEPFHSPSGGTGLGLAVVRATMNACGGSVELCDRDDARGTVATLRWPTLN